MSNEASGVPGKLWCLLGTGRVDGEACARGACLRSIKWSDAGVGVLSLAVGNESAVSCVEKVRVLSDGHLCQARERTS